MTLTEIEAMNRRERNALADSIEMAMASVRTSDFKWSRETVEVAPAVVTPLAPVRSIRHRPEGVRTKSAHRAARGPQVQRTERLAPFAPIRRAAPVSMPFERSPIGSADRARARAAEAI
jgi:hypothetical protein